eukprot:GFYU01003258.1.p1 GENE.GFYU01003258.1~~GFYU01003258.1.p1  ORF type:complete len:445 (+),score=81.11 GFYU01003258.1:126-1460(+)
MTTLADFRRLPWVSSKHSKPHHYVVVGVVLLIVEALYCSSMITPDEAYMFDWDAYMEQAAISKTTSDYSKIEGDTGPCVYPGGHLLWHSIAVDLLDWDPYRDTTMTTPPHPKHEFYGVEKYMNRKHAYNKLKPTQQVYALLYLIVLATCYAMSEETRLVPPAGLVLFSVSSRCRNIFVLGLFNDCVGMTLFYISLYFFTKRKWAVGCLFYSLSVSIKMNTMLASPALFMLLLCHLGVLHTILRIGICAAVQIVLGAPYLIANPKAYIAGAFNLGRQFNHEWSINFKWLPTEIFSSKLFALALLLSQVTVIAVFVFKRWVPQHSQISLDKTPEKWRSPRFILLALAITNFTGIFFARSLHYQFFVWYCHTVPFILGSLDVHLLVKLAMFLGIEIPWRIQPSTVLSSFTLQVSQCCVLLALWFHARQSQVSDTPGHRYSREKYHNP